MSHASAERPSVLFVCTANQARSPLAEVIARDVFERLDLPVDAASAGFLAGGAPACDDGQRTAARRSLDLSRHVSRQLDDDLIAESDLILTMTGDHVIDLVAGWPHAADRTFTLRELVDAPAVGPAQLTRPAVRSWAAERSRGDRAAVLSGSLDIADPMGRGLRAFRRTADVLDAAVGSLASGWNDGVSRPSSRS